MFVRGREYRREEIHRQLGGQRSSGIVTPRAAPVVLLFSSPSGRAYGYCDGWSEDGRWYFYTGEGQRGDMRLVRGNRAIAEHRASGRELWVFEFTRPGFYRCLGRMEYEGHTFQPGVPDRAGRPRTVVVFRLRPLPE